jgi:uncharacterized protein YqeY
MSELKAKLQSSQVAAMKAREAQKVQALRNIMSAIKKREVDERISLTDADIEKLLLTMSKQIQETLDQAKGAGRAEAVAEAEFEMAIVKSYLPEQMTEADVNALVKKLADELKASGTMPAGNAAMGALMKAAREKIGSKADGRLIQAAVKSQLGMS